MTSREEKIASLKLKESRIYWMRFGLSIFSAVICVLLRFGIEGMGVGTAIYLLSYIIVRYEIKPEVSLGKNQTYFLGLGTYIFTWLALWILFYTLLNTK